MKQNRGFKSSSNKQRISTSSTLFGSATEDELCVSLILLDLQTIISVSESHRSKFTWGCKRRRSTLDNAPPASKLHKQIDELRHRDKAEEYGGGGGGGSPDTPLGFSPSESDDDNKYSSDKKRSREQYTDMVAELTQRRDCLTREVESVRKYYNKLKTQNSKLKAMKQEVLKTCQREQHPQMELNRRINQATQLAQHYKGITTFPYQQPLFMDQMARNLHYPLGLITAQSCSSSGYGSVNNVSPNGIPDLNLSAEEAFDGTVEYPKPLDIDAAIAAKRARYAEARRMRKGKIKIKSMRNACGITLPRPS